MSSGEDASAAIASGATSAVLRVWRWLALLERECDLIVSQGHALERILLLATTDTVVMADAYDPMHLEKLEHEREQPRATSELLLRTRFSLLNHRLPRAVLTLCASNRQRAFRLGQLRAFGRLSPDSYEDDPHCERLIPIAPLGIDAEPPALVASRDSRCGALQ